jgi:hypothetical protein
MNGKRKKKTTPPKQKKKTVLQQVIEYKKKIEHETNARQELFCKLYATDREFFGNGVESYLEAYDVDRSKKNWYKVAQASASRLLSKVIIYERINELLTEFGLNDAFVDKQLLFLISQQADLSAKTQAIREYNKLKSRITEKIDHTTKGKALPSPIYGSKSTESTA